MSVNNITRAQAMEIISDKYISSSEKEILGLTEKEMIELNDGLNGGTLSIEDCLDKIVKEDTEKKPESKGWKFFRRDEDLDKRAIDVVKLSAIGMTALGGFGGILCACFDESMENKGIFTRLGTAVKMTAKTGAIGLIGSGAIAGLLMLLNTGICKKR